MSEPIILRDMRKTNCIVREIRFHSRGVVWTYVYGHITAYGTLSAKCEFDRITMVREKKTTKTFNRKIILRLKYYDII